jgi:hypothetical protein
MSQFAKSERIGTRSLHGTPVWHVYGKNNRSLALGAIWRSADGKTWEAKGVTAYVTGFATKTLAATEVRRQDREHWAARINVEDFMSHLTARRRTKRPKANA